MSPRAPGKARVLCIDQQDLTFSVRGGPPGAAYVARALSNEVSPNIGVGFARWEGAQVQWTVLYDEVIFVIEGCLQLQADGEVFEVRPGQVLWIPEGSELVYGGHAMFGYVVHPGNWKELHGLA
jgi:ethanolamine utilization protein EutQ